MVNRVEEIELDDIGEREMVDIIASMIESGEIWQLRGSFREVATRLIEEGFIGQDGKVLKYP